MSVFGASLASLTALKQLVLSFSGCEQISVTSSAGASLGSLSALNELTLSFSLCSQLSDVLAVGLSLVCIFEGTAAVDPFFCGVRKAL